MSNLQFCEGLTYDSLEPVRIAIPIAGKGYILVEADENASVDYQNASARAARFNGEGQLSGIEGAANIEPLLVSRCLYEAETNDINDPSSYQLRTLPNSSPPTPDPKYLVREPVLRKWPARIVKQLFDKVKEISDLDMRETEESLTRNITKLQKKLDKLRNGKEVLKNGSSDTTDTSS